MRLHQVELRGFAGVAGNLSVSLNANVVVIHGANGFGKTTICDAVGWALTGKHPRGADPRSLYGRTGETYVGLQLAGDGGVISISRSVSNLTESRRERLETTVVIQVGNESLRGAQAELWLLNALIPAAKDYEFSDYQTTLIHAYYMQQETLRDFLTNRSDDERFAVLSRMVGAGSLSDLVAEFDGAKSAWTRATNRLDQELDAQREQVRQLVHLGTNLRQELAAAEEMQQVAQWELWWQRSAEFLTVDQSETPAPSLTAEALTSRLAALQKVEAAARKQEDLRRAALAEFELPLPPVLSAQEITRLEGLAGEASAVVAAAQADLESARAEAARAEQELRAIATQQEEMAALAELALRHVSEACPVCGQGVDPAELSERLRRAVSRRTELSHDLDLPRHFAAITAAEQRLRDAQSEEIEVAQTRQEALQRLALARSLRTRRDERLAATGFDFSSLGAAKADSETIRAELLRQIAQISDRLHVIQHVIAESEVLAVIARLETLRSRMTGIEQEYREVARRLSIAENDVALRRATGSRAEAILHAMQRDADDFVTSRLQDIQPVLDQLYAAIDPHPTFRTISLATRLHNRKHRLDPIVSDEMLDVSVSDPGLTLSTSQANALAVSLFLAFNLGLVPTLLETLVLDDPLQNLDDVHLLGLVDLLRRLVPYRQLVVTTHDAAFAALLTRKLRPLNPNERSILVRLSKWDREGPEVETQQIAAALDQIRIGRVI